ncbi:MAG: hypothetical protein WDN44_09765 [Sphingomonas sp.]
MAEALGVEDRAAVQREAFAQWVLARFDLPDGPDLAAAGVTLTSDVRGYEQAKLRILNGAHSTLAYVGIARGHETVFEAMSDPALAGFVTRLVQDIAASLNPVEGLDTAAYADAVLGRFRNPAIRHLLAQIAWDGSQKLPYRLLDTIGEALGAGRPIDRLAVPIAAWIAFAAAPGAEREGDHRSARGHARGGGRARGPGRGDAGDPPGLSRAAGGRSALSGCGRQSAGCVPRR